MPQSKISFVQVAFLFTLAVGITNHVIIVPLILQAAHRDSWISALLAIPPIVLWTAILFLIMKYTKQQSLYSWFKTHYNSGVAWLIITPLVLFTLTLLFVTTRDTTAWTKATYLPKTPYFITVSLFVFSGFTAAVAGIRTLTIAAGILLPGVILFGFFVMSVNFQFKDYSYLLPSLTEGVAPVLHGTIYALGGLVEFMLLLGLQQNIRKPIRFSALLTLTLAVTGLIFGPLISAIAIFGPYEAADQRYPAFEQWRMVLLGKFISHLDFLSIYQWMSGSLIRISLAFYLTFDLMRMRGNKRIVWMLLTAIALIIGVSRNWLSDNLFFLFFTAVLFSDHLFVLLRFTVRTVALNSNKTR